MTIPNLTGVSSGCRAAARRGGVALLVLAALCGLDARGASAQATFPSEGTLRVAVVRIAFDPDAPPLNDDGTPSARQLPETPFQRANDLQYFRDVFTDVRAYFQEVSRTKLDLSVMYAQGVTQREYDKDMVYYGTDATEAARRGQLVQTAMTLADSGMDFSAQDLVIVIHSGRGQESDFTDARTDYIRSGPVSGSFTGDGRTFPTAILQSAAEIQPAAGEDLSIVGPLCYSIASIIGVGATPTGNAVGSYVGAWDLMDAGWKRGPLLPRSNMTDWSKPAHMSPFDKIRMGWIVADRLTANLPNAPIAQVEGAGKVYRLWTEGKQEKEYFLVENRQQTGFDEYLPDSGLLIWHINEAQATQADPLRLRVSLVQADGRQDIENGANVGDSSDPFPGQLSVQSVSDTISPNTPDLRAADGTETGVSVTEITVSAQTMRANLYIVPPMILSFSPTVNYATENRTPTFTATFSSKIDFETIKLTLNGSVVVSKSNVKQYYDAAARTLTYRPLSTAPLAAAQHVVSVEVQNQGKTVTEATGDITFRVNTRYILPGLRMVSVPYVLKSPDNVPGTVFAYNAKLARYHPLQGKYFYYPSDAEASMDPPADDPTNSSTKVAGAPAGLGYWINLDEDSPVTINGDQLPSAAYRIPVFAGWNMIGAPFSFAVDWNGLQMEHQGEMKTLADAIDAEWISSSLYTYQSGGYIWATAPEGQLEPWQGYWVKAKVSGTLIVPPVPSGVASRGAAVSNGGRAGAQPPAPAPRRAAPINGWRMRLAATTTRGAADTCNFVGISKSARDGTDRGDVEKPPVPSGGTIAVRFLEGDRSLAQDLRGPEVGTGKTWEFEVSTDLVQETVTLSWPDLSQVPSGVDVRIEDLATGRKVYTRTRGGYTYSSGQGGTRKFRLTMTPRRTAVIAITNVDVRTTRGTPLVQFNLSRDAAVSVDLADPTGRVRRRLAVDYAGQAGMNSVSTGRSEALAPGLYLVNITATASDGASVRASRPLVITR